MAGAAEEQAANLGLRRQVGGQHAVEFGQLAGRVEVLGGQSQVAWALAARVGNVPWEGDEAYVGGSSVHIPQLPVAIRY
jgi:hypothetical protein